MESYAQRSEETLSIRRNRWETDEFILETKSRFRLLSVQHEDRLLGKCRNLLLNLFETWGGTRVFPLWLFGDCEDCKSV